MRKKLPQTEKQTDVKKAKANRKNKQRRKKQRQTEPAPGETVPVVPNRKNKQM